MPLLRLEYALFHTFALRSLLSAYNELMSEISTNLKGIMKNLYVSCKSKVECEVFEAFYVKKKLSPPLNRQLFMSGALHTLRIFG